MSAIERPVARSQSEGIEWFSASELAILREHLESLSPDERIRECYHLGATQIIESEVDHVWTRLDHEPTPDEYRALAKLLREAATKCERKASEVAS
jgi:16S rRNA U1498 N3-methylase RsmE